MSCTRETGLPSMGCGSDSHPSQMLTQTTAKRVLPLTTHSSTETDPLRSTLDREAPRSLRSPQTVRYGRNAPRPCNALHSRALADQGQHGAQPTSSFSQRPAVQRQPIRHRQEPSSSRCYRAGTTSEPTQQKMPACPGWRARAPPSPRSDTQSRFRRLDRRGLNEPSLRRMPSQAGQRRERVRALAS